MRKVFVSNSSAPFVVCGIIINMNPINLVLAIFEALTRIYSIIGKKPYLTVEVKYAPQRGTSGKVTKELIAFTIINESGPEVEVQKTWFLTSFNRPVLSKFIDSKIPIKVPEKNRATYFVPIEEFKTALNRSVGETITKAVVLDQTERKHIGRVDKVTQEELAR